MVKVQQNELISCTIYLTAVPDDGQHSRFWEKARDYLNKLVFMKNKEKV